MAWIQQDSGNIPQRFSVNTTMILLFSCCRFISWTSIMSIPHSTTSQRCSTGGALVTVEFMNSLACSRNHCGSFELCGIVFYLKHPSEVECMAGIKGWIWSETILRWAVVFKSCLLETISKLGQENILQTIELPPSAWTGNTRQDGVMVSSCLHQILSQWDSRLIRRNNIFLIFYSGEPCSYLTGAISGLVFFCYRFDVLCFQRCSFAYLRCNECLSYCCLPTSLM